VALGHDHPVWAGADPIIYNVTLTLADTEYLQALPGNTKRFAIIPRNSAHTIKIAFIAGNSATEYITVDSRSYFDDNLDADGIILYMQSANAGAIVEIIAWN
jgi:hypothetical protein